MVKKELDSQITQNVQSRIKEILNISQDTVSFRKTTFYPVLIQISWGGLRLNSNKLLRSRKNLTHNSKNQSRINEILNISHRDAVPFSDIVLPIYLIRRGQTRIRLIKTHNLSWIKKSSCISWSRIDPQ